MTKSTERTSVAIIGAGFGGICAGIALKKSGNNDFLICERGEELGGTWRDNRYPGAACDVQSFLYSYSFELWDKWTRVFAPAADIYEYTLHCVNKYGIRPHARTAMNIVSADWDATTATWTLRAADGRIIVANHVILATGGLSQPQIPDVPGRASFRGEQFHTAKWNHNFDIKGKRVAIVGTGASAIQVIPAIAADVGHLSVFQRTPAWVIH